jgi:hypothetical protein
MACSSSASVLAIFALGAVIACAPVPEEDDIASAGSNQTDPDEKPSPWTTRRIGGEKSRDFSPTEGIGLAVRGEKRHMVYLGSDRSTRYLVLGSDKEESLGVLGARHHELVLDASGEPIIAFSEDRGKVEIATKRGGSWEREPIGVDGALDAMALDATGALHIASHANATVTLSTRRPGSRTFEHAKVPGKPERDTDFFAFAMATDRRGTVYLMLSSHENVSEGNRVRVGPDHTFFAQRPVGGSFSVDPMTAAASAGSLVVDTNDVVHAVLAASATSQGESTRPLYLHRAPDEAKWSAPEQVHVDGYRTALAVDARGALHLAFAGNASSFFMYATRPRNGEWSKESVFSGEAEEPEIVVDASGKPTIAYRDRGGYRIAERRMQ